MELDVRHPILLAPGQGEVVGDTANRRVEILCDHDLLCATWTRFGPGQDGASAHVHHTHCDLFYVLAGELTVLLGAEEHTLPTGTLALAPPLVVHCFRNASPTEELRYLNIHAPGAGFANYLRGVKPTFDQHDPPADGGRPASEAIVVPPGTEGVLVEREEIRVALLYEPSPPSDRLTCLYALEAGRLLQLQA